MVRVCGPVFRNLPHSYTWSLKNRPIHILDRRKCCPIHILPFDFYTHLLLVVRQFYRSHFIQCQENKQPRKISDRKNIQIYWDVRKAGPFTYESRKTEKKGLSYTFC